MGNDGTSWKFHESRDESNARTLCFSSILSRDVTDFSLPFMDVLVLFDRRSGNYGQIPGMR